MVDSPSIIGPNLGFKNIPTVLGPMARNVEDIELASRVVFGKSANHSSAPVPYREVKLRRKLKFGYYFNDGISQITPACHRAVTETVEALRKQGHECIEFELPSRTLTVRLSYIDKSLLCSLQRKKHLRHILLYHPQLGARISSKTKAQIQRYGMKHLVAQLVLNSSPEPKSRACCCLYPRYLNQIPGVITKFTLAVLAGLLHILVGWYLQKVDPVLARVWKVSKEKSTHDLLNWEVEKDAWIQEFQKTVPILKFSVVWPELNFEQVWEIQDFDAIIGPGLASPPLIHK